MADSHRGATVGMRIAMLISRATVATHIKLAGVKHRLIMKAFHAMSDEIAQEAQHVLGPIYEKLLSQPDLPDSMRPHLEFISQRPGQLSATTGMSLAANGILSSLALIINNELFPAVGAAIAASPNLLPDVNTIADMVARQVITPGYGDSGMAAQGISSIISAELYEAARQYPDITSGLMMLRRGFITTSQFELIVQRNGSPAQFMAAWERMVNVPLSPADAALAVLRGNISLAEGENAAQQWGVDQVTFAVLMGNTGEPLALMQLLEARRRGFIDDATLKRGILQSRIRDEWIPVAEQLAYSPISVADAVNAAVQGHITLAEAATIVQQNGVEPGSFATLYQTAGEPLSRIEMSELYNRGEVTEAEVKQALRESRIKDKYVDDAFKLHVRLLEPRMLSSAVAYGALTAEQAIKRAMDYGYTHDDATVLVHEGTAARLQAFKNRVTSALETMYEDNAISNTTAESLLKDLGYDPSEVKFIMQAAEFRREAKSLSAVMTVARKKYVDHRMTDTEVRNYLSAAGVPSAQADYNLHLWGIERSAQVRILTEAQVAKAVKLQLITPEDGLARLVQMGYNDIDAGLLLAGA